MNKEEIENAKKFINNIKQTIQENNMLFGEESITIKAGKTTEQNIETLLQYIEILEGKIGKINNKLQEIMDRNYKLYTTRGKQKEVNFSEWSLADELLDLMEDK